MLSLQIWFVEYYVVNFAMCSCYLQHLYFCPVIFNNETLRYVCAVMKIRIQTPTDKADIYKPTSKKNYWCSKPFVILCSLNNLPSTTKASTTELDFLSLRNTLLYKIKPYISGSH